MHAVTQKNKINKQRSSAGLKIRTPLEAGGRSAELRPRCAQRGEAAGLAPPGGQEKRRRDGEEGGGGRGTYSRIWAGARPPRLKLTSRRVAPCAPRFASAPTNFFFTRARSASVPRVVSGAQREATARREGPLGPPVPTLHGPCADTFLLLLKLTDVTGCVLPNPEVCVSGNGAQLPPGGHAEGHSDLCRPMCTTLRPSGFFLFKTYVY